MCLLDLNGLPTSCKCNIQKLLEAPFASQPPSSQFQIFRTGRPKPSLPNMHIATKSSIGTILDEVRIDKAFYEKTNWITGCSTTNKLYCWPCILFSKNLSKSESMWTTTGYSEPSNTILFRKQVNLHREQHEHIQSLLVYINYDKKHPELRSAQPSTSHSKQRLQKVTTSKNKVPECVTVDDNEDDSQVGYISTVGSGIHTNSSSISRVPPIQERDTETVLLPHAKSSTSVVTKINTSTSKQHPSKKNQTLVTSKNKTSKLPESITSNSKCTGSHKSSYKCEVCRKSFVLESHLRLHLKKHSLNNEHTCTACSKSFNCSKLLSKHIKTIHQGTNIGVVKQLLYKDHLTHACPFCDFNSGSSSQNNKIIKLVKHLISDHKIEKPLKCRFCDAKFDNFCKCKEHVKMQHNAKIYTCNFCSCVYDTITRLQAHIMQIHTKKRDYECSICKKKFVCLKFYTDHLEGHKAVQELESSEHSHENQEGTQVVSSTSSSKEELGTKGNSKENIFGKCAGISIIMTTEVTEVYKVGDSIINYNDHTNSESENEDDIHSNPTTEDELDKETTEEGAKTETSIAATVAEITSNELDIVNADNGNSKQDMPVEECVNTLQEAKVSKEVVNDSEQCKKTEEIICDKSEVASSRFEDEMKADEIIEEVVELGNGKRIIVPVARQIVDEERTCREEPEFCSSQATISSVRPCYVLLERTEVLQYFEQMRDAGKALTFSLTDLFPQLNLKCQVVIDRNEVTKYLALPRTPTNDQPKAVMHVADDDQVSSDRHSPCPSIDVIMQDDNSFSGSELEQDRPQDSSIPIASLNPCISDKESDNVCDVITQSSNDTLQPVTARKRKSEAESSVPSKVTILSKQLFTSSISQGVKINTTLTPVPIQLSNTSNTVVNNESKLKSLLMAKDQSIINVPELQVPLINPNTSEITKQRVSVPLDNLSVKTQVSKALLPQASTILNQPPSLSTTLPQPTTTIHTILPQTLKISLAIPPSPTMSPQSNTINKILPQTSVTIRVKPPLPNTYSQPNKTLPIPRLPTKSPQPTTKLSQPTTKLPIPCLPTKSSQPSTIQRSLAPKPPLSNILPTPTTQLPPNLGSAEQLKRNLSLPTCSDCGNYCLNDSDLKVHKAMHTFSSTFSNLYCEPCNIYHVNTCSYNIHQHLDHKNVLFLNQPTTEIQGYHLHRCHLCLSVFTDKNLFYIHCHPYTCYSQLALHCIICKQYFESKELFELHASKHTQNQCMMCEICSQKFSNYSEMTKHVQSEHNVNMVYCSTCEADIPANTYFSHLSECTSQNENLLCPCCSSSYTDKELMINHMQGKLQFDIICRNCLKSFPSLNNFVCHKTKLHPLSISEYDYYKLEINKPSMGHQTFTLSKSGAANKTKKIFAVSVGKGMENLFHFKSQNTIKYFSIQNVVVKNGEASGKMVAMFTCKICKSHLVNTNGAQLETHVLNHNIHSGLPNLPCLYCGFICKTTIDLEMHIEIHHHTCKLCHQILHNKQNYLQHETEHTKGLCHVITCICGRDFKLLDEFQKHVTKEHKSDTVNGKTLVVYKRPALKLRFNYEIQHPQCSYCNKCFESNLFLKNHMGKIHGVYKCVDCKKYYVKNYYEMKNSYFIQSDVSRQISIQDVLVEPTNMQCAECVCLKSNKSSESISKYPDIEFVDLESVSNDSGQGNELPEICDNQTMSSNNNVTFQEDSQIAVPDYFEHFKIEIVDNPL